MDKHILVFGDSITYGAWDIEGGWVARLRKYFDQRHINNKFGEGTYALVYNLGVSGDKSTNILKRFRVETEARKGRHGEELIILFDIGSNDCIYNEKLNGLEVSPEDYKKNYLELIKLAKEYSQKIVIIGSMPTDKRVDPIPWAPGRHYRNEDVKKYNKMMKEVAEETGVGFLEIYEKFIHEDYSTLLADGVHMTTKGHKKFYEIVKNYLIDKELI